MSLIEWIMSLFGRTPQREPAPIPPLPQEQRAMEQEADVAKQQALYEMEQAVQMIATITAENLGKLYESRKAGEKIARKMQRRNEANP